MNKALQFVIVIAALAAGRQTTAAELYIAPNGNDAHPGTKEQPFATLARARDAIRAARQTGMMTGEPLTVTLRAGTYRRTETFALTAEDSGTAEHPVVWQAAPGESVRLLGGLPVTNWAPVSDAATLERLDSSARGKVLQANLKEQGVTDFGEMGPDAGQRSDLFCQGRYMPLARYPNEGWLRIAGVPQEGELKFPGDFRNSEPTRIGGKIAGKHYGRFCYSGDRPSRWRGPSDLWVHGYWVWDYMDQYHAVDKLDIEKREVWPKPPYHFYGYHEGARYYFLNVLEELDLPGEWYLDRKSGMIYFWPPESGAEKSAVFSVLRTPLVQMTNVKHLRFEGLTLEGGRAGAIAVHGGERVAIAGCTLRNLAHPAIAINGGTNHLVRSCDLYELGGGGIALTGGDRKTLTPGGHAVQNCHIHHIGRVRAPYNPAVRLDGVGLRVSHSLIHDCPHGGLGYAGNDHTIEYCEFTRIGYDAGDTGTIYTAMDWTYRGHVIRHNRFHNIHSPRQVHVGSMTVYLDLPCGGVHLYGNMFFDNQRAFFTNSGRDCLIENNIFVRCEPSVYFSSWRDRKLFEKGGAWRMVERLTEGIAYDQPPYSTRYPELLRLFKDGDIRVPTGNVVRCNISTGGQFLALHPEVDFNDVKVERNLVGDRTLFTGSPTGNGKSGLYSQGDPLLTPLWEKSGNVLIEGDPGFVDAAREDFHLKPGSAAWKLGFKPIPFDQIGLQKDEYRTSLPLPAPIISPSSQPFLGEMTVQLLLPARSPDAVIRYTLDGSEPTAASPQFNGSLTLKQTATVRAGAFPPPGLPGEGSGLAEATFTGANPVDGLYLSDLPALDVHAHAGMKRDTDYQGGKLELNGKAYGKGLLLCPEQTQNGGAGCATWMLSGGLRRARRFTSTIGIEDMMKEHHIGSAVFIVELFRNGKWERLFESPVMKLGQTQEIDVDIAGGEQLRLRTTDAGDGIQGDHALWADARLQ
jgi:hypothetical protein